MRSRSPSGTTPITEEEKAGLRPTHLTTQAELNRWEQDNIMQALEWIARRRPTDILNTPFIQRLHRQMFGTVWTWAGQFRRTDRNIGIPWSSIAVEVRTLCDDTRYRIDHDSFPPDEIAVRFHHRLVQIHPFPNGNGRHSRLMTDILLANILHRPPFTWGGEDLRTADDPRHRYIAALRSADDGEIGPLMAFVRS